MLKIENVTQQYHGFYALNEVTCEFTNGIYGLLGPNGAGKSTIMRILVDVLKPTKGHVTYNGKEISVLGENYRDILGYLPQGFRGYSHFTAQEFLRYVASLKGIDSRVSHEKVERLLELVGLSDVKKKKLKGFSGGMTRRVGIAQALLNDPQILILDEPTAGLDPSERIRLRGILSEISKDKIILLSTHIVSDIEYVANEVLLLKRGEIIQKKSPKELISALNGQVWSLVMTEDDFYKNKQHLTVVNSNHLQGQVETRIISERQPHEKAITVEPRLEDIYVYYFGAND